MHEIISGWEPQPVEREHSEISYFPPCAQAVEVYRQAGPVSPGKSLDLDVNQAALQNIIRAEGYPVPNLNEIEVYNPSLYFYDHGRRRIVGRTEGSSLKAEHQSVSVIFEEIDGIWHHLAGISDTQAGIIELNRNALFRKAA